VLFSHPKDFTPVCTTELGYTAKLKSEFEKRNVKVIGLSVDSVDDHKRWAKDIEETQGQAVNFPMIGDQDKKVANLFDMIHPNANDTLTVRSVFVIDPNNKVRLTLTYPVINNAKRIWFLVTGAKKAEAFAEVQKGPNPIWPASLVQPIDGELRWYVDKAVIQKEEVWQMLKSKR